MSIKNPLPNQKRLSTLPVPNEPGVGSHAGRMESERVHAIQARTGVERPSVQRDHDRVEKEAMLERVAVGRPHSDAVGLLDASMPVRSSGAGRHHGRWVHEKLELRQNRRRDIWTGAITAVTREVHKIRQHILARGGDGQEPVDEERRVMELCLNSCNRRHDRQK